MFTLNVCAIRSCFPEKGDTPPERVLLMTINLNTLMKDNHYIQLLTAAVLSLGGLVMLFCGIFIEPHGQIHESLLIGFGEVATFAGSLFGIDYVYKQRGPRKS